MGLETKNYFVAKEVNASNSFATTVGVWLALGGPLLALVGLFIQAGGALVGGLIALMAGGACFVVGLVLIFGNKRNVYLSGTEYDNLVKQMIVNLGSDAREYLGLDASEVDEIEPISFEGYKFIGTEKTRKDPTDNIWRSDLYERVTIFFTQNEIHLYKVALNTLTSKITETTDVLFYDDVVSVSTKNEVEKIGYNTIDYISFNLVSKGGNNVSVALNVNDNRQRSINAMRAMIKEKKTQ